jgi:chemotaxis protein MotB
VKKKKGGGGGGANWMDTYGDMVTLLLCFFVLLYSMSTISEENWKALVMSFNPKSQQTITETLGGSGPNADYDEGEGGPMIQTVTQEEIDSEIEDLFVALQQYIEENSMQDSISVTEDGGRVFVSFNQTAFFNGNSYALREESLPILDTVSDLLSNASDAIDEVRILGHTAQEVADTPNDVHTDRFLASNRATNVLVYIQEHSVIDPARLVSEGYGQWHPVGDNATSEGRAQNRRVEMIISGRNLEEELGSGVQSYSTTS